MTAACLRRRAAIRIAKAVLHVTLRVMQAALAAELAAIRAAEMARRPGAWARYVRARLLHPVPGLPRDGTLSRDDMRAFIAIVENWRLDTLAERSRR